jgi:hypothetical protein
MKRTSVKSKPELKLKRRLQLVRTTIREMIPTEFQDVNGGYAAEPSCWLPPYTNV